MVEHTGSTGGYRSVITRFPAQHTSVAILCNVSNAAPSTLARRVADYVLRTEMAARPVTAAGAQSGATSAPRVTPSGVQLAPPVLAGLPGRYHSDELGATYELSTNGTSVVLTRPRARPDTLVARDSTTLVGSVGTLRLTIGPDRRVESFILDAGRVVNVRFVRRR